MFDLGGLIEAGLRHTSASAVTNGVLVLLLVLFVWALVAARRGALSGFVHYTPNLLTSLGILGTFVGIVIGLLGFDVNNIDASIGPLLAGLKTAFITSMAGMFLAIAFKTLDSSGKLRRHEEGVVAEQVGPEDIYKEMRSQREALERLSQAVAGDEDATLVSQIRLLRSEGQEQSSRALEQLKSQREYQEAIAQHVASEKLRFQEFTENLWSKLDEFAEMLSKSATEQVINALKEVISDFNRNLTEQFGENFRELNAAVEKLVQWQEQYRTQLEQMSQQYEQGVVAITQTEQAVAHISEESKQIPATMGELKTVLETTQHQLAELERHLEAFRDMRDRAVEAVPQIREQMDTMVNDVSAAVKDAGNQITNASQEVNQAIVQGAEDFKNNVNRTNEGLVTASDHLVSNSEQIRDQLESTVADINEQIRNLISVLVEQSHEVGQTLVQSNDQLRTSTQEVQYQVTDSIEKMQKRLESTLEEVFQAQTREMQRSFNAVEEELRKALGTTGDAVNKQLEAMDSAMQQELERVMNEMARALTGITGKFTSDYTQLVDEMSKVVRYGTHRVSN